MTNPAKLLLVVLAAAFACDTQPFAPTQSSVAGTYHLQALTVTDIGSTRDWVAMGATMTITLAPNGTTTGRCSCPNPVAAGVVDVDMQGTWTLTGETVEFNLSFNTLVSQVAFFARENRLVGNHAYDNTGVSVRIILTK